MLKVKFVMRLLAVLALAGSTGTATALTVNPAQAIIETVTIQPIVVSNDDGSYTAEVLNC